VFAEFETNLRRELQFEGTARAKSEGVSFYQRLDAQADRSEPRPYNDPAFTTPSLRAWFMEMFERFPALSGPYAASSDQRTADYCIGYHLIYVAISFDKHTREAMNWQAKTPLVFTRRVPLTADLVAGCWG
jgi:hypothetical protein